jgi:hypothetical protein
LRVFRRKLVLAAMSSQIFHSMLFFYCWKVIVQGLKFRGFVLLVIFKVLFKRVKSVNYWASARDNVFIYCFYMLQTFCRDSQWFWNRMGVVYLILRAGAADINCFIIFFYRNWFITLFIKIFIITLTRFN